MWISEIWRYPVKSMGGEPLQRVALRADGIEGDRVVHVAGEGERVYTARTKPKLLGHHGTLSARGEPLVDGRPWDAPSVAEDVRAAAGPSARLVRYDGFARFDILPLLVATDGAITAFGYDRRRLRPNLVIGGVEGLAERGWEGKRLHIGGARGPVIGIRDLRDRCIMTTFDPDTQAQDVDVLRSIRARFGGSLALNCMVLRGGVLALGDAVELIDAPWMMGSDP
jgi:uncharacterized protein